MDGQTLHACANALRWTAFYRHCWPFGPQYDVFKSVANIHAVH